MQVRNSERNSIMPSCSFAAEPEFRGDIEGLRAVAVLLVVAFHTDSRLAPGGYIGVDIFFVVSGYLITSILLKELERTGRIRFAKFYVRRARRLLPAAILTAITTLIVGYWLLSPAEIKTLSATAVAHTFYISNFWFARHSVDYFGLGAGDNPLLHTWSLSVEEQFYIVWPAFLLLVCRFFRTRRSLAASVAVVSIISFVSCIWLTADNMPIAFFSSPTRAWEFGLGGLASLMPVGGSVQSRRWLGVVGSAGILGSAIFLNGETLFPGYAAAIPALGTAAILIAGAGSPASGVGQLLSIPALQGVGRLSYSWYLWHWPVLVFAAVKFPDLDLFQRLVFPTFALALAFITHHVFENPIRYSPILVTRTAASAILAVLLMGIGISAGLIGRVAAAKRLEAEDQRNIDETASYAPASWRRKCLVPFLQSKPQECVFGHPPATGETIVLFGDSHAQQWFPALERVAMDRKRTLVTLVKAACPIADVPAFNMRLKRISHECHEWRAQAIARIVEMRPTVVVMSNHTFGHVERGDYKVPGDGVTLDLEEWKKGLASTLQTFEEAKIRTVLIQDTPRPGFHVPNCVARLKTSDGDVNSCNVSIERAVDSQALKAESEVASAFRYVSVADLTNHFCDATCPAVIDQVLVYRDGDHISGKFAEKLTDHVAEEVEKAASGDSALMRQGR
jgi:peptidoglycan/LPS O-acetylase OafA/YrhL